MDYKNGKIYKITDNAYTKMYIGSTTQPLSKRFSDHRASYKLWQDGKGHNVTIFDIFNEFGVENCKIELIEEYECENKMELQRKEGEHIKNNDCVNRCISGRTQKEWYEQNKNRITAYQSEKILCECGKEYTKQHKSRHIESKKHINHLNLQA